MLATLVLVLATCLAYVVIQGVLRLFVSPLSHIPGPKLAALTYLYEMYFDLFAANGGQFCFQIKKLHQIYGPVVRINPNEVHIDDPEFYGRLYATGKPYDKLEGLQYRFNIPGATFSTPRKDLHAKRRSAIEPFFSKRKVSQFSTTIQATLQQMLSRLNSKHNDSSPLELNKLWAALTADIIFSYSFGFSKEYIMKPDFEAPFLQVMDDMASFSAWTTHFPLLVRVVDQFPVQLVQSLFPPFASVINLQKDIERQISQIDLEKDVAFPSTIFHTLLDSHELPQEERSSRRLRDEAISLIAAGVESTKQALVLACFHIADNPRIQAELQKELDTASKGENILDLITLESLPFLRAIILEALRLSYGIVERLPRVIDTPLQYNDLHIPAGTAVSMDAYHMHSNSAIFEDATSFKPERWLEKNPLSLTNFMVVFGRGTRMCIGMNMARAILYQAIASLFSAYSLSLYDTDVTDVAFVRGRTVPRPKVDSKGVRVLLHKRAD